MKDKVLRVICNKTTSEVRKRIEENLLGPVDLWPKERIRAIRRIRNLVYLNLVNHITGSLHSGEAQ